MSVLLDSAYKKYYVNKQKVNMKIVLPWFPKELSPNATVHYMKKAKYKALYKQVCKEQTLKALELMKGATFWEYTEMDITYTMPDKRWRDTDNLLASVKNGLDGMCEALEINDRVFEHIHIHRSKEIGGFITVELK